MKNLSAIEIKCQSVTYAIKAKNFLNKNRYKVKVKRINDAVKGCSYLLYVYTDQSAEYILSLLQHNGINASL
ncbi:MAG: hypothetical protein E7480_03340 [Ruminococcaceae bacterium]|nr:hypothetical protein [Oscillospiraceae bacterium]